MAHICCYLRVGLRITNEVDPMKDLENLEESGAQISEAREGIGPRIGKGRSLSMEPRPW